jgi:hypothetical protein
MPKDRHGNEYEIPVPVRIDQDKCEITNCNSNSGFSCSLSVYDHKDAIRASKCSHRKFKLRNKKS